MSPSNQAAARAALSSKRYETCRRICRELLLQGDDCEVRLLLAQALCSLGEHAPAERALDGLDGFAAALLRLRLAHHAAAYDFYVISAEAAGGRTYEEYRAGIRARVQTAAEALESAVGDAAEVQQAIEELRRAGHAETAERLAAAHRVAETPAPAEAPVHIMLGGRIRRRDGTAARGHVVLGVEPSRSVQPPTHDDESWWLIDVDPANRITSLHAALDEDGRFHLAGEAAAGTGFLAIEDADGDGPAVRFLARDLPCDGSPLPEQDLIVDAWAEPAAPAADPPTPPATVERAGSHWQLVHATTLANPFWIDYARQDLRLDCGGPINGRTLLLLDGQPVEHEILPDGHLLCLLSCPARSSRSLALYRGGAPLPAQPSMLVAGNGILTIDTGAAAFRLPADAGDGRDGPVLALRGCDGAWRLAGRMQWPDGLSAGRSTRVLADGPLEVSVEVAYRLADGRGCRFVLTAHRGERQLLVEESGDAIAGAAFVLAAPEFAGGRGYLHWNAEGVSPHWHDLVPDQRCARLPEQVPWWSNRVGFAWAVTCDGLDGRDMIAVYSRRRGDWRDDAFAAVTRGPGEDRELDWPYPEMVGSTVSEILGGTDARGVPAWTFPRFAGVRHWGLLAGDFAAGDGPRKELWEVRHKTSFPRLQDLHTWDLRSPDRLPRPAAVVRRDELPALRRRLADPTFAPLWARVRESGTSGRSYQRGVHACLVALLEGGAALAWRRARRLADQWPRWVRQLWCSRENNDTWSPVGSRTFTPAALEFDLLAGTGAFTADEERELRACMVTTGHFQLSGDFMNWRYGARNANFEADRVDAIGTIGMVLGRHRDGEAFIAHAVERTGTALEAYTVPGSGKWYENPACYYLVSLRCRVGLLTHLAHAGAADPDAIPRLDDFLRWITLVCTPPVPQAAEAWRAGCRHEAYATLVRGRLVAPVGDNGGLGPDIPEAALIGAELVERRDPVLAADLRSLWAEAGRGGGYHGDPSLMFLHARRDDLTAAPLRLPSRRLEGYGAVFRGGMGTAQEFCLLAKCGPGGYRYHRSEGSFILVADGRPLVWDGSNGSSSQETWRHATIGFHEVQLPPAPGRIERFVSTPRLDYAQGVAPVILTPGQPIFLSDNCHIDLVAEARRRAAVQDPPFVRAWAWVKDAYVVIYDRIEADDGLVHRWNLPVVADSESGELQTGLRFNGRFGTDLQVIMPDQNLAWSCRTTELALGVSQRLLEAKAQPGAGGYLAVLRPLPPGAPPLTASLIRCDGRIAGVHVTGPGIDDRLILGRTPVRYTDERWSFAGRAGALLIRDAVRDEIILAG